MRAGRDGSKISISAVINNVKIKEEDDYTFYFVKIINYKIVEEEKSKCQKNMNSVVTGQRKNLRG